MEIRLFEYSLEARVIHVELKVVCCVVGLGSRGGRRTQKKERKKESNNGNNNASDHTDRHIAAPNKCHKPQ